jgi:hypothetical protein
VTTPEVQGIPHDAPMDCGNDVITSCIVDEAKGHSHTGVILFVKRGLNPVNSEGSETLATSISPKIHEALCEFEVSDRCRGAYILYSAHELSFCTDVA